MTNFLTWARLGYKKIKTRYYTMKVSRSAYSVGNGLKVNGPSRVTGQTSLGDNVNFNGMQIRGDGKVSIGRNFHSGPECLIITRYHNYDFGSAIPYDDTFIYKDIIIEENVWLGMRCIVLAGVTIGEGSVIQAGSVVVSDIPRYSLAGGHPCRVFSERNIEHYETLKARGSFN